MYFTSMLCEYSQSSTVSQYVIVSVRIQQSRHLDRPAQSRRAATRSRCSRWRRTSSSARMGPATVCHRTLSSDAETAAAELGIALTSRSMGKSEGRIPLAGIPYHQLERYLERLVTAGHRVAIAEPTVPVPMMTAVVSLIALGSTGSHRRQIWSC